MKGVGEKGEIWFERESRELKSRITSKREPEPVRKTRNKHLNNFCCSECNEVEDFSVVYPFIVNFPGNLRNAFFLLKTLSKIYFSCNPIINVENRTRKIFSLCASSGGFMKTKQGSKRGTMYM